MFFLAGISLLAFTVTSVAILRRVTTKLARDADAAWETISSQILVSLSLWTLLIFLLLRTTGWSFGPIQYSSGGDLAMFCFWLRSWTWLAFFLVPLGLLPFELLRFAATRLWNPQSLLVGVFAWMMAFIFCLSNPWFFPDV